MEGKTHYENIIGGTDEEKEIARDELQALFDFKSKRFSEYELEKTSEDLEIIQRVETLVDEIVTNYDGDPKPIPLDHIHLLKPESVFKMSGGKITGGVHRPLALSIDVEKRESRLGLASTLAHELFHLKSYKSARIGNTPEDIRLYRSGLSMIDKKDSDVKPGNEKEYFSMLEEAIVAQCVQKFLKEIEKDDLFQKEIEAHKKFMSWVISYYRRRGGMSEEQLKEFEGEVKYMNDIENKVQQVLDFSPDEEKRQSYAAGMFDALHENKEVKMMERYKERKKMYELLDKIITESNGMFKDRDQLFDEFAKANFSGNYLPLARIIENMLGKGSFRKLAEEFSIQPE